MHGEPYIHLTWHQSIADSVTYTDADVKSIYANYANKKKRDLSKALGMNSTEAGKIVAQVTGLYDLIENRGDALSKQLYQTGMNAAKTVRAARPMSLKSMANKIVSDKKWMDSTLRSMQSVLNQSNNFNEELVKYFVDKAIQPKSLATRGINVNNLKIMDLEKKTATSLISLQKSLDDLNDISTKYQLPIEPKYVGDIDKLLASKTQFKGVSNIIRGAGQRILNTQGFLLEGVVWGLLEGAVHDGLIEGLPSGIEVGLEGGAGGKTDVALRRIAEDNKTFNIGLSMKSSEKGVTKEGYYGKHSLRKFYEMAKMLDTHDEYVYSNMLASGKSRVRAAQIMNRMLAARAAWEAVTGGAKDEIYFFVYLNKIVSAEDMYSSMASGAEKPFVISIDGITQIPSLNVRMADAYTRSHAVLDSIRRLQNVQIMTKM